MTNLFRHIIRTGYIDVLRSQNHFVKFEAVCHRTVQFCQLGRIIGALRGYQLQTVERLLIRLPIDMRRRILLPLQGSGSAFPNAQRKGFLAIDNNVVIRLRRGCFLHRKCDRSRCCGDDTAVDLDLAVRCVFRGCRLVCRAEFIIVRQIFRLDGPLRRALLKSNRIRANFRLAVHVMDGNIHSRFQTDNIYLKCDNIRDRNIVAILILCHIDALGSRLNKLDIVYIFKLSDILQACSDIIRAVK